MFHGGTTRGFMNGANFKGDTSHYEPQVSSYDYDAPLDEAGNATAKFRAFREVITKYRPAGAPALPPVPAAKPSRASAEAARPARLRRGYGERPARGHPRPARAPGQPAPDAARRQGAARYSGGKPGPD
uniref:beta-galactosidase n=1 Tax=Tanacetum cinerariifolium TaxID=118510 RepID=A0A699U2P2_TANCI|nr:beta-galactosidase 17 [Tanacetum cinerariifolium]